MALVPDDPKQRKALFVGLLALALFYVFWAYWYTPNTTEVETLQASRDQLDLDNDLARIRATEGVEGLEEQLAVYKQYVAELEKLIPRSEEVAGLLNAISSAARQTGVSDPDMRPEPEEVGEFYTKEIYEIAVTGDYHNIGRFLAAIASLPRVITSSGLTLVPYLGDPEELNVTAESPLTATLLIQTYILPDDVPQPLPAESGVDAVGG
jgi:type IV pilus assembly protein PilO